MPRLFALDHNFPEPIVEVLSEVQEGSGDAELVSVSDIDPRMADLDDWEIMLALHHHERPWDGLITTDSSILNQPPELAGQDVPAFAPIAEFRVDPFGHRRNDCRQRSAPTGGILAVRIGHRCLNRGGSGRNRAYRWIRA